MSFGEQGPQTRYDEVETSTQQLQAKKTIEYDSIHDKVQGDYGITLPKKRDDQSIKTIEEQLKVLKDDYEPEWSNYQLGLQDFFNKMDNFSLEDVDNAYVNLRKSAEKAQEQGRELMPAQITYALLEPLRGSESSYQQVGGKLSNEVLSQKNQKLLSAIQTVDFTRLSPEDQKIIGEKMKTIKRSMPLGGVPGVTRDQYATAVLIFKDPEVRKMDIFPSPQNKKDVIEKVEKNQNIQKAVEQLQKDNQTLEKAVSKTESVSAKSIENPAKARTIAEKIDPVPSSTIEKTNTTITQKALDNLPVIITNTGDKVPTTYDETLALDLMEKYHVPTEQKDVFMMGITLQQWAKNPSNELSNDQQKLVDEAKTIMQNSISNHIQDKLTDETEALYISWMGKMMGDVDMTENPTYDNGVLSVGYRIPGFDTDELSVHFGDGVVKTTNYLPEISKDANSPSYSAMTEKTFSLGLPNMDVMVTDALAALGDGADVSSLDALEKTCNTIVREKSQEYDITAAKRDFESHTADLGAKFAMRDMMTAWKYRESGAQGKLLSDEHKKIEKILNPTLKKMSVSEKKSFTNTCNKLTERARGTDSIQNNPHLKNSNSSLVRTMRGGDIGKLVDAFVVSAGGEKKSIATDELNQFTDYIDGIKKGTISPKETFVSYVKKEGGKIIHPQIMKKLESGQKNTEVAHMEKKYDYLGSQIA